MNPEKFLQENFLQLSLIHETATAKIWLVKKIGSDETFILRKVARINLPYREMLGLEQKNLPKIFFAEETESETFVIEEFLQGMNLLEYVKLHGEFSEQTVINFALELCDCLKILHARKILHRDIKPSNLFLTDNGELKLIDFDAGRVAKTFQQSDTQIIGTPGFAPPEQYGFSQTDERADIYALGLTLKMLLGFESYHGIFEKVLNKCTEFDPARRYKNISEVKSAIEGRKNYLRRKKFLIGSLTAGIFFVSLFFNMKSAETPQVELVEKNLPVEKVAEEILTVEEKITPQENIVLQENFPKTQHSKIIYQEISSEPAKNNPVPEKVSETVEEKTSDKITALIEEYNKNPATYEVEKPQKSFEVWKKNNYIEESEEIQQKKFDEEMKIIEVRQRMKNFEESLPEDVDKAKARHEFYKSELKRLNLE